MEFASIWRGMGGTVDLFFRKELPLRCSISFCFFLFGLVQSLFRENAVVTILNFTFIGALMTK